VHLAAPDEVAGALVIDRLRDLLAGLVALDVQVIEGGPIGNAGSLPDGVVEDITLS
jgi:hypothetical protein